MQTNKRIVLLPFLMLLLSTLNAQDIDLDSTFSIELPAGHYLSINAIVQAATTAPDEEQLNFDTTSAYHLEEIVQDYDYIPAVSDALIKDRLSCLQNQIPLYFHPRVRLFIDYFSVRRREYTLKIIQRKNLFFPLFEKILAEYGMPDELKYLSIIESALIPNARSRVGAVGLWQFMPATGRLYGLKQNYYRDERMDPEKSTRAACKYLKYLYETFGDWELALAAYNCGPGNVRKGLRRSGKPYKFSTETGSGMSPILGENSHFWDIYTKLPRETRSYLPQFVAMMYVLNYAEEHNLIQEQPFFPIPSDNVYVSQSVDLEKMAEELNVCYDDLKLLNAELRYGYLPKGIKNYPLIIPSARLDFFINEREEVLEKSKYTGRRYSSGGGTKGKGGKYYHTVRSGESLGLIAQRNGVSLSSLRAWNNIYTNRIYPGQKLVVYGGGSSTKATPQVKKAQAPIKPQAVYYGKTYTVQSGDSLWLIAKKFQGLTVEKIKKLNNLTNNKLKPGQKLRVG